MKFRVLAVVMTIILIGINSVQAGVDAYGEAPENRSGPTKIVGGETSDPASWKWMAALLNADSSSNSDGHFCGASLVRANWVITAAHCLEDVRAEEIVVLLGAHDLKNDKGVRINVKKIIPHPDYNRDTMDNDIALLELEKAADAKFVPIGIWEKPVKNGTSATILGWGNLSSTSEAYPDKLQQVSVPIVSNSDCNIPYKNEITENMLCAGFKEGGKDSCQGDSGGPLVISNGNQWYLAGVVSWGEGCAGKDYYGVYARTSRFIKFLTGSMKASASSLTAGADKASTPLNKTVTIDVLSNDSGNGELSIAAITKPEHGKAVITNNKIVYTSEGVFLGKDRFKYTVKDSVETVQADVDVDVVFDAKEAAKNCFIESL